MATRLDRAYMVEVNQLRLKLSSFAMRYWNSMGSWRDDDLRKLLDVVVPRITAGQQRISDLTDAYLSRVATEQGYTVVGRPLKASTQVLRGISDAELYARPLSSMHNTLSNGGTVTQAVAAGGERLASIVATNMQLAKTHSARRAMIASGARSYERVLTGNENCALCVIASTQRYWVSDLSPMHPGCDCGVRILKDGGDGQIIHPDRLEMIHETIESQFGDSDRAARLLDGANDVSDYLDLITTYDHGEYGPTLTWRDQKHTEWDEIPVRQRPPRS